MVLKKLNPTQQYASNTGINWSKLTQKHITCETPTGEIVFHRPAARNLSIPPPRTERDKQATLLGIDVTDTLSIAAYVDRLLMQVNQRLYLLFLHQSSGLQRSSLHFLFSALVINKLTYALPAYAGQLTIDG